MADDARAPFNEEVGQAVPVDVAHGEQAAVGLVDRPDRIEMTGSVVLVKDELTLAAVYRLGANYDLLPMIVIGIADQHIRPKVVLMSESIDDLKARRVGRIANPTGRKSERTKDYLPLWRPNRLRVRLCES